MPAACGRPARWSWSCSPWRRCPASCRPSPASWDVDRAAGSARLRRMRWVLVVGLVGLAACSSGGGAPREERALPERIIVSSPAFDAGAAIPERFTCKGENVSPPLAWSGVAAGTAEVALVVDDPDAPRGTYV